MYDKEIKKYHVRTYIETFPNEYHFQRITEFNEIEEAINFGKKQIEKGKKVRIEEISIIKNWN